MKSKKIVRISIASVVLIIGLYLIWSSGFLQNLTNRKNITGEPDISQYYNANYKEAFNKLLPAAESGDAVAQVSLGNLYSAGLGVKQNYEKAVFWYRKGTIQNNASAFVNLGSMYQFGLYFEKNYAKALEMYKQALDIDNSNSVSMYNMALIYLNSQGKYKNFHKGVKLLEKASSLGNTLAMSQLGASYYTGSYGLSLDYSKVVKLLKESSNKGNSSGQNNLAVLYFQGKALKKDNYKAYFWFYIASKYGNNDKAKQLINAYDFDLTDSQKQQAISEAQDWIKTHKEINSELTTSN